MKKTLKPVDQALMQRAKELASKLVKKIRQTEEDEGLEDQTSLWNAKEMARQFLWESVTTDLATGQPKLLDPALADFDEDLLMGAVWGEVIVIPDEDAVDDIARRLYRQWQEKPPTGHHRKARRIA